MNRRWTRNREIDRWAAVRGRRTLIVDKLSPQLFAWYVSGSGSRLHEGTAPNAHRARKRAEQHSLRW